MLLAGAALFPAADVLAQERDGWYVGLGLGIAVPDEVDVRGRTDDVPTNCDGHFPPAEVDGRKLPLPLQHPDCRPGTEGWTSRFDLERGALIAVQAGYVWRSLRLEAEYTQRRHGGDRSTSAVVGDKEAEFVLADEWLDEIEAHALFANIHYQLPFGVAGFTPFVGAGAGMVEARAGYGAAYRRNADADVLTALGRHPAAAGTLSAQDVTLKDRSAAYQILIGADRPIGRNLSFGATVRRVALLDDFEDAAPPDVLRGHAPTVAPGGRQVVNTISTRDLGCWSATVELRYFF